VHVLPFILPFQFSYVHLFTVRLPLTVVRSTGTLPVGSTVLRSGLLPTLITTVTAV